MVVDEVSEGLNPLSVGGSRRMKWFNEAEGEEGGKLLCPPLQSKGGEWGHSARLLLV